MGTKVTAEISKKSQYYISKHQYYELKHFCLQYKDWVAEKNYLLTSVSRPRMIPVRTDILVNRLEDRAIRVMELDKKIQLVEQCLMEAGSDIYQWLKKGVTEACTYEYLRTALNIPCGRDYYYEKYRRFFYVLSVRR